MKKIKFHDFLKNIKSKQYYIDCTNFLQSKKSPHCSLREEVGPPSKRKRVLCWSINIISLWKSVVSVAAWPAERGHWPEPAWRAPEPGPAAGGLQGLAQVSSQDR